MIKMNHPDKADTPPPTCMNLSAQGPVAESPTLLAEDSVHAAFGPIKLSRVMCAVPLKNQRGVATCGFAQHSPTSLPIK